MSKGEKRLLIFIEIQPWECEMMFNGSTLQPLTSVCVSYGGEMEDVRFTQDSGPRGDEDEDEEDADMDFGEETGSEDTSNTDDDEPEQPIDDVWRGHSEDFDANDLIHANGDVEDEDDDEDDDDEDEDDDDDDGDTEDQPEGDDDGEDSVHDPGVIVWDVSKISRLQFRTS